VRHCTGNWIHRYPVCSRFAWKEVSRLAITREKKGELVSEYVDKLQRSQAVIVTEYRGLTVKQIQDLRRELRSSGSELLIGKNTLLSRALVEVGMAAPKSLLHGPTAVAFCFKEIAAPAKALNKYAKDSKILVVKGGVIGKTSFDEAGVQQLAELPGRMQLLGQVVGVLQAPLTGLVNVLAGTMRGLVNVLNARVEQLEKAA
jgi:large subunit ribosomal protein L10